MSSAESSAAAILAEYTASHPYLLPPTVSPSQIADVRHAVTSQDSNTPWLTRLSPLHARRLRNVRRNTNSSSKPVVAVFVGGSITAQKEGYRPLLAAWLERTLNAPVRAHTAAIGNVGSSVLFFTLNEWVLAYEPDVVVLECSVNDGDALVEGTNDVAVLRAFEGILRAIKTGRPSCAVVVASMPVRADVPSSRRTGTKAWVDAANSDGDVDAALCYSTRAPNLHAKLAAHYGYACVRLHAPMIEQTWFPGALDAMFRDDCHHTALGAALAASLVAEAFCVAFEDDDDDDEDSNALSVMPSPCEPLYWTNGATLSIGEEHVCSDAHGDENRRRWDVDPLTGARLEWWLLDPNDECTVHFDGTGVALLTHVGPDAGYLSISLTRDVDGAEISQKTLNLFDRWCYYYRLTVLSLATDLPYGAYTARMRLLADAPDRAVSKKEAPPGVQGALKLWLSYALVLGKRGVECAVGRLGPQPFSFDFEGTKDDGASLSAHGNRLHALKKYDDIDSDSDSDDDD